MLVYGWFASFGFVWLETSRIEKTYETSHLVETKWVQDQNIAVLTKKPSEESSTDSSAELKSTRQSTMNQSTMKQKSGKPLSKSYLYQTYIFEIFVNLFEAKHDTCFWL